MQEYRPYSYTIEELAKNKLFVVPVYQRPYSWTKIQINDLLDDLFNSFAMEQKMFVGTIYGKLVENVNANYPKYEIVDGQQRIITFALILLCLYAIGEKLEVTNEMAAVKNCLWKSRKKYKDLSLVTSGSIEKEKLMELFDTCYDDPLNFENYLFDKKQKNFQNEIENNLIISTQHIYQRLINELVKSQKDNAENILSFSDFLLTNVNVIFIETSATRKKIFEMFEAINSKGKQLDEIDLIKTYIFSELPEKDYQKYLDKWGYLIQETSNQLEDYLWIYVKTFIKYYKYSVKIKIFKNLIHDPITQKFYGSTEKSVILKSMIDDMCDKVEYYSALTDISKFQFFVKQKKILLQYNIFSLLKYEHSKPLIFKALYELDNDKDNKENQEAFLNIFKYINSFMILFQTLNSRDSKDSIPTIQAILQKHYNLEKLNVNLIKEIISNRLLSEGINMDNFKLRLKEIAGYKESGTDIGFVLLAISESWDNNYNRFSEDKANSLFKVKNYLSIDHLLVQNPKADFPFAYYKDENDAGDFILRIKPNRINEFPSDIVDGMYYDRFKIQILNKLGNLRLSFKDENSARSNATIKLSEFDEEFVTYNQVLNRMEILINNIVDSNSFFIPEKPMVGEEIFIKNNFILNFDELNKATGHKPVFLKLFEQEYKVYSTKEIVQRVLSELFSFDKIIFEKILNGRNNYGSFEHPWVSDNYKILRNPQKIINSPYFFEGNRSVLEFLKFVKKVFSQEYSLDLQDLQIIYEI